MLLLQSSLVCCVSPFCLLFTFLSRQLLAVYLSLFVMAVFLSFFLSSFFVSFFPLSMFIHPCKRCLLFFFFLFFVSFAFSPYLFCYCLSLFYLDAFFGLNIPCISLRSDFFFSLSHLNPHQFIRTPCPLNL